MRTLARDAEDAAYLQMKVGAEQCPGHSMTAVQLIASVQLHPLSTDKMSQSHSQVHTCMYRLLHRHQRKPQYLDQAGRYAP